MISPDGQRLAFTAVGSDGRYLLWVRALNAATAHPLEGTEGATFPFWSSDSRYVGFFANGKLNRMDASGGQPLAIADATDGRGGFWGADGTILFTPDTISPIYRVSSSGGTPQPVTKLNALRQEVSHRWPEFLPDTKHFLFYVHCNAPQNNGIYAASLDGSEPKLLVHSDFSNAVYAPPGYLLFVRQGTLMAQGFDANSMRLIGDAMPLAEQGGVKVSAVFWRGLFTVSGNGLLAYEVGNSVMDSGQLLWFDRSGKQIGEKGTPSYFAMASLSPDGSKLAAEIGVSGTTFNIWVFDLARGIRTRLTFSSSIDAAPSWSPDGKTIAFASNLNGQFHLYQKAADGTGSTLPLVVDNAGENEPSFSTDGRYLIFRRLAATPGSHAEIWALPLFGDRKAFPVVQSPQFDLTAPALSPDGKWLAYTSHETGRPEIYIVPFGHGSGRLTPKQIHELESLTQFAGHSIDIRSYANDAEGFLLGSQIVNALSKPHIAIADNRFTMQAGTEVFIGVTVTGSDKALVGKLNAILGDLTKSSKTISRGLAGVSVSTSFGRVTVGTAPTVAEITVGLKPIK